MSVAALIGDTPLCDITALVSDRAGQKRGKGLRLYGKLEGQNPGGSVKDRPAAMMIDGALSRGELRDGMTVVEATSGNTGIALAMVCASKGIAIELVMPESATAERVATMRAYGARVTLTSTAGGMEAAIDYARAKGKRSDHLLLDQFSNADNPRAHFETTGPEIWRDTHGEVTHVVCSMGTTGTIMGLSRFFAARCSGSAGSDSIPPRSAPGAVVEMIGVQPVDGARIPGIRRWPPAYVPAIYDASRVTRIIDVTERQATAMTMRLSRELGLFVGMSSGGAAHAACELVASLPSGADATVVVILCDRGDRYLSLLTGGPAAVDRD